MDGEPQKRLVESAQEGGRGDIERCRAGEGCQVALPFRVGIPAAPKRMNFSIPIRTSRRSAGEVRRDRFP
jgi:hypothetical protein